MNRKKRACSAAVALVLLSLSGISAAADGTYYRWIDASGTPVNSDRPPPIGIDYEVISTGPSLYHPARVQEEEQPPSVQPSSGPKLEGEAAPAQREVIQKNPEACTAARKNLEVLNTHARIRVPDGQGNYRYINEEEKAAQRAIAEGIIAKNCE